MCRAAAKSYYKGAQKTKLFGHLHKLDIKVNENILIQRYTVVHKHNKCEGKINSISEM